MNPGVGFFLIFLFVCFMSLLAAKMDQKFSDKYKPEENKQVLEKRCPAHKWAWEEQPGIEPKRYFIRCQWCGRLPGYDREQV